MKEGGKVWGLLGGPRADDTGDVFSDLRFFQGWVCRDLAAT